MDETVTAFDTSASWVGVCRCETEYSYIFMILSKLYHELVYQIEHFNDELDTLHQHDKGMQMQIDGS